MFFTLCWLILAGCYVRDAALAVPEIVHVGDSHHCSITLHGRVGGLSYTAIALYDTAVFMAISWRLSFHSETADDWKSRLMSVISGNGLYKWSRALLRDGQLYYL